MELNGHEYRIGKLDAFKQLHIARRLAPLMAGMVKAFSASDGEDALDLAAVPIAEAIAQMSDADVEYVTKTCLRAVKRIDSGKALDMMVGEDLRYQDIDLATMLQLTVAVVKDNLGSFFLTGQSLLNQDKA